MVDVQTPDVATRMADAVKAAADALAHGELVAFPTETVYGLGARADDDTAVAKIYAAKGRPADHPLIVHVLDVENAQPFAAAWPPLAQRLAQAFWPGPLTLIVPRREGVAAAAAGGAGTIALRAPSHPLARALLQACCARGVLGVAAPSANRFGRVSPTRADHVRDEFGSDLTVLDGGPCDVGIESAIVDVSRERAVLLRPGALSIDALQHAAGEPVLPREADTDRLHAPKASGTLEAHYAPNAPVRLMTAQQLQQALELLGAQAPAGLAVYSRTAFRHARVALQRRMPSSAEAAAHELFAVLRELDAAGATLMWVEQPPDDASWDGVRDRLQRAAVAE